MVPIARRASGCQPLRVEISIGNSFTAVAEAWRTRQIFLFFRLMHSSVRTFCLFVLATDRISLTQTFSLYQCPRTRVPSRRPERRARQAKPSPQFRQKRQKFGMIAFRRQKVQLRAQNAQSLLLTKTTLRRVALSPKIQA